MTKQEFITLPMKEKANLIVFNATYLWSRTAGECSVFLYHLDGLFIEVFYHMQRKTQLFINVFVGAGPLESYLDTINLDILME